MLTNRTSCQSSENDCNAEEVHLGTMFEAQLKKLSKTPTFICFNLPPVYQHVFACLIVQKTWSLVAIRLRIAFAVKSFTWTSRYPKSCTFDARFISNSTNTSESNKYRAYLPPKHLGEAFMVAWTTKRHNLSTSAGNLQKWKSINCLWSFRILLNFQSIKFNLKSFGEK